MKALIMPDDDTLVVNSLANWDGQQWDSLGSSTACGDGNFCPQIYRFLRYEDQLYVDGGFPFIEPGDSLYNWNFARIVDPDLHLEAVTCHEHFTNGISTIVPSPDTDTLYFTGYRDSLCALDPTNVFAYDGQTFERWLPFDDWHYDQGDYVGFVFRFRNLFYMTGMLYDSVAETSHGLLRYMEDHWEPVPGFETPAPIKDFLIQNDTLYLGGFFFEGPGVPGNMVVSYDGENWDNLGGGITFDDQGTELGIVLDLEWWHGKLLASGQFYRAGGVPIEHIAMWDGHRWCGSGADFEVDNPIHRMTIWRDSLYVVGGFDAIDGVPVHRVAKWDGGDFDAVCSPSVGLPEPRVSVAPPIAQLLDGEGLWRICMWELRTVTVLDAYGREIGRTSNTGGNSQVDLRGSASGIYFARCLTAHGAGATIKLYKP